MVTIIEIVELCIIVMFPIHQEDSNFLSHKEVTQAVPFVIIQMIHVIPF